MKSKRIRPIEDYGILLDGGVVARGTAVVTGLSGNPHFPTPPVDPAALLAAVNILAALIAQSLDGSKKVIAEKNNQREVVINMLRLLGRYVEFACKNDLAIFKSSGFEPALTARTPLQSLSENVRSINHGAISGQVVVQMNGYPKALSQELRFGGLVNGADPNTWTNLLVTGVRSPVTVNGLLPGTTYAFQARAMTKEGYTDWSDSVTFMAT